MQSRTSPAAKLPRGFVNNSRALKGEAELGNIMAQLRRLVSLMRGSDGIRGRQSIGPVRVEGRKTVLARTISAALRAILVGMVVALPALMATLHALLIR